MWFKDVSPKMESELESIEGPSQHNEEEPLADTPDIDDLYDGFQLFEERNVNKNRKFIIPQNLINLTL